MLSEYRRLDGTLRRAEVTGIARAGEFILELDAGAEEITAASIINAAGPFVSHIADLLGEALPVEHIIQQKLAFEDDAGAIGRGQAFMIDLDPQTIDWTAEEAAALASEPDLAHLTKTLPGAIHCRPVGGLNGTWVKLGWAFNQDPTTPRRDPPLDEAFPEIVLRGAARLNPALKTYYGRLPRARSHYGGYYTMTAENWPLIGPMRTPGAYMIGALSGFGTMAAPAAGELCARHVLGLALPNYASALSLERYDDEALMAELGRQASRGVL